MAKVLIVDDSAVDRLLFKSLVEQNSNYTVIEAENATDAMEKLAIWDIDIVVTDLQMPDIDGLEFVGLIQKNFPEIPTILATGMGSADIATKALAEGAAGYVPKSKLSELLVPTIDNILDRTEYEGSFAHLLDCSKEIHFHFALENDPRLFALLVELVRKMLGGVSPLGPIDRLRLGIAVEQALHNALYRGNLGLPSSVRVPFGGELPSAYSMERIEERINAEEVKDRRIDVEIRITPERLICVIEDEGDGFEPEQYSEATPGDPGRGLVLMNTFMDSIRFNDKANHITLEYCWDERSLDDSGTFDQQEELGRLICTQTQKAVPLRNLKCVVGSHRTSHLIIRDNDVSKHHCVFVFQNDNWFVKDLDSKNGTIVNGKAIKLIRLQHDDVIQIGPRELKIKYTEIVDDALVESN